MSRLNQTGEGVRDAFDFWLSQHPISFPQLAEDAIKAAFVVWLDEHSDQLIAAIAEKTKIVQFMPQSNGDSE